MITISQRAKSAPASPIRKLVPLAEAAEKKGTRVYRLNIGDPDFAIPQKIRQTLQEIATDITRLPYTNSKGLQETLDAWEKYYRAIGIDVTTQDLLVTTGGK